MHLNGVTKKLLTETALFWDTLKLRKYSDIMIKHDRLLRSGKQTGWQMSRSAKAALADNFGDEQNLSEH